MFGQTFENLCKSLAMCLKKLLKVHSSRRGRTLSSLIQERRTTGLGAGRSSKFPSTSKQIQHHWHTIRSHNHSCNKMAKQGCLDSGRIFNLRTWPALRAGQAQTLKYLPLCKPHCLAILLQLWLWLLIECQQF